VFVPILYVLSDRIWNLPAFAFAVTGRDLASSDTSTSVIGGRVPAADATSSGLLNQTRIIL